MLGNNNFLTGKRVYSSGGYAPNRGRVSAQGTGGYVRRSLTQQTQQANMHGSEGTAVGATRFGNDGNSDTRSGLAQAAMARVNGGIGTKPGHQGPMSPNDPNSTTGPIKKPRPGGGKPGDGGKPVPHVIIKKNGQMKLPYDADYSDQVMSDLADFNDQLMQMQIASQQQAALYSQGVRDEGQQYGQQKIADLAGDSGAGMAFSSRYATDVGKSATIHQNNINSLTMQNDQFNQQNAAQKAGLQDSFNAELQQAALQRARNAGRNAGHLGYGHAGYAPHGRPGHNKNNKKGKKK